MHDRRQSREEREALSAQLRRSIGTPANRRQLTRMAEFSTDPVLPDEMAQLIHRLDMAERRSSCR